MQIGQPTRVDLREKSASCGEAAQGNTSLVAMICTLKRNLKCRMFPINYQEKPQRIFFYQGGVLLRPTFIATRV